MLNCKYHWGFNDGEDLLLTEIEYLSYQLMWQYEGIRKEFEKVKKKHLNSPMVEGRLYAPDLSKDEFGNRLSEIVLPVYQSAKSAGFREWEYTAI